MGNVYNTGKGDEHDPGIYRGIILLIHVLKVQELFIFIRRIV